jgi:large subunit ribosomal protein L20
MVRVKRGKIKNKKRRRLLKAVKGYRWGRKSKKKMAREAFWHAMVHSYRGRKEKKRVQRKLWQIRLNAALREKGSKYSVFMHKLKEKNIKINRKILSQIAIEHKDLFDKIFEYVNS